MDNDSKAVFPTLRDCSMLGMVPIQHLSKSHTCCSKESGGKVETNVLLRAMTQKASY